MTWVGSDKRRTIQPDYKKEDTRRPPRPNPPRPTETTTATKKSGVHPLKQRHRRKHPHLRRDSRRHKRRNNKRQNHQGTLRSHKPPPRHRIHRTPRKDTGTSHRANHQTGARPTHGPPPSRTRILQNQRSENRRSTLHAPQKPRDTRKDQRTPHVAGEKPLRAPPHRAGGTLHAQAPRHPPLPGRQRKNSETPNEPHPDEARLPGAHQHQHPRP